MLWLGLALAANVEAENERLMQQIMTLEPKAQAIAADGKVEDWEGFHETRHDGPVLGIAVAPTATHLKVKVRLRKPLGADTVWIALDAGGRSPFDGSLRVSRSGASLKPFDVPKAIAVPKAQVALSGKEVEVVVDWASLRALASPGHHLSEAPKDIVRVRATRWSNGAKGRGLAVASYVLSKRTRIEPRHRFTSLPSVKARLPLQGTWFVSQGAMTEPSHDKVWAFDLVRHDDSQHSRMGPLAQDALAWGQPVVARGRGTVRTAVGDNRDRKLDDPGGGKEANRVKVDYDDGTRMTVLHLRKSSVSVREGQRVSSGTTLGQVGNSGKSSGPHLHVVWAGRDGVNAPARLQQVVVNLNLGGGDPWRRELDSWAPSEGYFVTQTE